MLVGNTQHFSLFDLAGHKLTSQADWTVSDSSIADPDDALLFHRYERGRCRYQLS